MKRLSVVGGICASLLLGAAGMAVAQDEHKQDEHKNDKQENAQPQSRQEQARPQEQPRPEDHRNDDRRNQQPQSGDRHPQKQEDERRMQQPQEQERHEQARPQGQVQGRAEGHGRNQRRIPDSDFHAHFGRGHHFVPGRMQVYNGQPQFYYGGYTFALIQAWPDDWSYDADDYYIDEFDGEYWLFNLENPGVRLELIIVQ